MLSHLRVRLFLRAGFASLALQPLILIVSFEGSVAAHGLSSTLIASLASFCVMLLLLWAIAVRRSLLAALAWILIAIVAVCEMVQDTMNGWLLQPHHVLGAISLMMDAICAILLVLALLDYGRRGAMPGTETK